MGRGEVLSFLSACICVICGRFRIRLRRAALRPLRLRARPLIVFLLWAGDWWRGCQSEMRHGRGMGPLLLASGMKRKLNCAQTRFDPAPLPAVSEEPSNMRLCGTDPFLTPFRLCGTDPFLTPFPFQSCNPTVHDPGFRCASALVEDSRCKCCAAGSC